MSLSSPWEMVGGEDASVGGSKEIVSGQISRFYAKVSVPGKLFSFQMKHGRQVKMDLSDSMT